MLIERTLYFAKPGKAADVLETRRRGSRVRVELGLPAGTIYVRHGESDAPDVQWECRFESADEQARDLEARTKSEAFEKVRADMRELIERFERHILRVEAGGERSLEGVSLRPAERRFPGERGELTGFLYVPPGEGPFPCVVLNHGSGVTQNSTDLSKPSVASVLMTWGIACFFPNRWGYGRSPGAYWRDEVTAPFGTGEYDTQLVRRLHHEADDVVAALAFVESLDGIDSERIGVMGSSFGGTVSLLAAAKCDRFQCAIDFAGAAMNWEKTPRLRELMKQAARALETPIFLIQAENDYSTGPTRDLAKVLGREGKTFQSKIFPPFGVSQDEGHWFERAGSVVWGRDVRHFLESYL